MKSIFLSKMFWTNVAAVATGVGLYVESRDPEALIVAVLGGLNILLRYVTTQAVHILPTKE